MPYASVYLAARAVPSRFRPLCQPRFITDRPDRVHHYFNGHSFGKNVGVIRLDVVCERLIGCAVRQYHCRRGFHKNVLSASINVHSTDTLDQLSERGAYLLIVWLCHFISTAYPNRFAVIVEFNGIRNNLVLYPHSDYPANSNSCHNPRTDCHAPPETMGIVVSRIHFIECALRLEVRRMRAFLLRLKK